MSIFDVPISVSSDLLIRTFFSQEKMAYHRKTGRVEYRFKGGKELKGFDALEWVAAADGHIPEKGEQMARYYGYYNYLRISTS